MLISQFEYFWGPYCILSDECPIQSLVIYDEMYPHLYIQLKQ